jgi:hypothetical protein
MALFLWDGNVILLAERNHPREMNARAEYEIDQPFLLDYDSRQAEESMSNRRQTDGIDWKWAITTLIAVIAVVGPAVWFVAHKLDKLDEHIQRVEIAVRIIGAKQGGDTKTLIDEALQAANIASADGRTDSAKTILDIANRLLAEEKASGNLAPQKFFDSAIRKYNTLGQSPQLAEAAWNGATALAEYRSQLNSVPPGLSEAHIGELGRKGPFRYLKDSFISGPQAIQMSGESGFVLDGFYLENDTFVGATIIYKGGPVILQNVRFVNCKFEIQRSPHAAQLLEAAVKESVNLNIS